MGGPGRGWLACRQRAAPPAPILHPPPRGYRHAGHFRGRLSPSTVPQVLPLLPPIRRPCCCSCLQVSGLVVAGGKVQGVTYTDGEGQAQQLAGDAVVLATGGFGANRELLRKYAPQVRMYYYTLLQSSSGRWSRGAARVIMCGIPWCMCSEGLPELAGVQGRAEFCAGGACQCGAAAGIGRGCLALGAACSTAGQGRASGQAQGQAGSKQS